MILRLAQSESFADILQKLDYNMGIEVMFYVAKLLQLVDSEDAIYLRRRLTAAVLWDDMKHHFFSCSASCGRHDVLTNAWI